MSESSKAKIAKRSQQRARVREFLKANAVNVSGLKTPLDLLNALRALGGLPALNYAYVNGQAGKQITRLLGQAAGKLPQLEQWAADRRIREEHDQIIKDRLPPKVVRLRSRPTVARGGLIVEGVSVRSTEFLRTRAWRTIRYAVLQKHGRRCQCCGATNVVLHVDHIKPRDSFPELALVESNLQVLCEDCNLGKGAWDDTDWRQQAT